MNKKKIGCSDKISYQQIRWLSSCPELYIFLQNKNVSFSKFVIRRSIYVLRTSIRSLVYFNIFREIFVFGEICLRRIAISRNALRIEFESLTWSNLRKVGTSIYGIYLRVISAQDWLGKKILHARVYLKCIFGSYIIILRCMNIVWCCTVLCVTVVGRATWNLQCSVGFSNQPLWLSGFWFIDSLTITAYMLVCALLYSVVGVFAQL